jgi:hypothetical protein
VGISRFTLGISVATCRPLTFGSGGGVGFLENQEVAMSLFRVLAASALLCFSHLPMRAQSASSGSCGNFGAWTVQTELTYDNRGNVTGSASYYAVTDCWCKECEVWYATDAALVSQWCSAARRDAEVQRELRFPCLM